MSVIEGLIYAVVIFVIIIAVLAVIAGLIKVLTYFSEKIIGRLKK